MTKVFSFAAIALLALGEGASFAYAVTEETTTSTTANEKVLKTQETDASIEEAAEASSDKVEEVKGEVTEETTEESTESTEEKEEKKAKGKTPRDASDPVTINDATLYQLIRYELNSSRHNQGIADGATITKGQMEKVETLNRGTSQSPTSNSAITDLDGLQYATNLKELDLSSGTSDTYTSLPTGFSNLTSLVSFSFARGALNDISELKNNPSLQNFSAKNSVLTSLEGLTGCEKLQVLNIDESSSIKNFKGLEKSPNLKEIDFTRDSFNLDRDLLIPPTAGEPSYEGRGLQSLEGLKCKESLEKLNLDGHPGLKTLDGLEDYTKLSSLSVVGGSSYNGFLTNYDNSNLDVGEILFDTNLYTPAYRTYGLQGQGAISALSGCSSLESVNLRNNAIESIDALAGKSNIKTLNIGNNLIKTLAPLSTTNQIVTLTASSNLLENLDGLQNMSALETLDVSSQSSGARVLNNEYYVKGLLADISKLNTNSLVDFDCSHNRLKSMSSLKGAANLVDLSASDNLFENIEGQLDGCANLESVGLSYNKFVSFKDMGLGASQNSLKTLYIAGQGTVNMSIGGNSNNGGTLLENLKGLKDFTVLETLNMNTNQITDSQMVHIPHSIVTLEVKQNELQEKAFESFKPSEMTKLKTIEAASNHISDITPLEAFENTSFYKINLYSQKIIVPKHGGTATKKTSSVGYEVDVLKTQYSTGLTVEPYSTTNWKTATVSLKSGTHVLDIDDPNYDLNNKSAATDFSFKGNSKIGVEHYQGTIYFTADYQIGTKALLDLVPTDIDGNKLTQVEQGQTIYWRLNVKGENENNLRNPRLSWNAGYDSSYTAHYTVDPYDVDTDLQKSEYENGFRIEIDKNYQTPVSNWWNNDNLLHDKINKDIAADITYVTRVADDAVPGKFVYLQYYLSGSNFDRVNTNAKIPVVPSAGQELKMSVPERLDFGKDNQADKKAKTYGLNAKGYSSAEKTKGLKIRVTDTKKTTSRTDWKVVGQLSDLTNTAADKLENGSASPKLTIGNIDLLKVTNAGEASESTSPITTNTSGKGNPTWATSIDLTAGGSSTKLAEAPKADGEGVWDYNIPFDDVKLEVPANVNNQAGRTFNGKITWTLEDVL